MNIDAVEKVEILPMNPPPNNSYSFRNGNPIIQFQIGNAEKFLLGSSLRLNGDFRLNRGVSTETNVALPDNANNKGGGEFGITINNRIGLHSCIQQITISNQNNQSLETIRNYNRYLASVVPNTHSQDDLDTSLTMKSLGASHTQVNANMVNNEVGFCMPLLTGLLNSNNPIPLGNNGIRGMIVQIELAPDSSVIHNSNRARATDATANNGAFYQLRNLSLTFDLLVPDESGKSKMAIPATGAFQYNSVNNLYSVVNTNDLTQTLNLGTSNTLSVIHNFIPTTHINNYLHDGFKTTGLQNVVGADYGPDIAINEVHFTKGGVKFPLDYEIDSRNTEAQGLVSVNIERNYVNAIKPMTQYNHNLKSLWTSCGRPTKNDMDANPKIAATEPTNYQNTLNAAGNVVANNKNFGVGVSFDPVSRVGVNFKNTPYGIRIKSALNGNSPNSIYTYTLNKNTLQYSPGGIVVSN